MIIENTKMASTFSSDLSAEKMLEMYTRMQKIRAFNDRQAEESKIGKILGYVHLYTGQEAIAVGSISSLEPGDKITSTHRAEGHLISAGVPLNTIMAECFGRATGVCGGRGGPMGLAAAEYGVVSAYEIVGGGIALATGIAWAFSLQQKRNVVLCFFGDGAANQGILYECLNMAALWKLPIIYLCENNGYAVDTSVERAFANPNIAERGSGFGLPGIRVDGTDVLNMYKVVGDARHRAVTGGGPTFIEAVAPRWCGHHLADPQWYYRTRQEVSEEKLNCPITKFRKLLIDQSILNEEQDQVLQKQVVREVDDSVQFAEASEWPNESTLDVHLFASPGAI